MTKALENYVEHNIVFSTAGMVTKSGIISYLSGEISDEEDHVIKEDGPKADTLLEHILFASTVDNFNCYLSEVLVEVLEVDPRPISGRKFEAKEAFAFDNIDDLRKRVLEKFVIDLGYQNVSDLTDFLEKNFGIQSLSHWLTKLRLNRIIQIRNIITHNRGIANKTYLFKSKSKIDSEGEKVWVQFPLCPAKYLSGLVDSVDAEIEKKFFS